MDEHFFDVLLSSYLWSLLIILPIAYGFIKYAVYITNIHLKFIFGPLMASLIWSCTQYTGLMDDYIIFGMCCLAGGF